MVSVSYGIDVHEKLIVAIIRKNNESVETREFKVVLVNAHHVKNVSGHKTDKKDSAWLSKLLLSGLLKGSFISPRDIHDSHDLVRY